MAETRLTRWFIAENSLHCASDSAGIALCGVDLSRSEDHLLGRLGQAPQDLLCSVCCGVLAMTERLGGDPEVKDLRICAIDEKGIVHALRDAKGPDDRPWLLCGGDGDRPDFDPRIVVRFVTAKGVLYVDFHGRVLDRPPICSTCFR